MATSTQTFPHHPGESATQTLLSIGQGMNRSRSPPKVQILLSRTSMRKSLLPWLSLAALVPKPRVHLTRYHGVFAPHSALRAQVTPAGRGKKTGVSERNPAERHRAMTWAQRLTWPQHTAPVARRDSGSSISIEHAQRARGTGAPWAAVSSASRTARIPAAGLHFPQRNRLLHHSATVTAGRRLHAVQLHWLEHGL